MKKKKEKKEVKILLSALSSSIIICIIIYLCLTSFNQEITNILVSISNGEIKAINIMLALFPIVFIVCGTIVLGKYVIQGKK